MEPPARDESAYGPECWRHRASAKTWLGETERFLGSDHALRAGLLVEHHKDPFDRTLIAQAQAENLAVISNDAVFDRYAVRRIW